MEMYCLSHAVLGALGLYSSRPGVSGGHHVDGLSHAIPPALEVLESSRVLPL